MTNIKSIGFALDPNNVPSFLLDWEVTRLCNLDCTYCGEAGHDNSTKHPPLDECLRTIDFMIECKKKTCVWILCTKSRKQKRFYGTN